MARLSNISPPSPSSPSLLDRSSVELGHLLSKLQQSIFSADPERERRLRTSEYERVKIASNLNYARASLTKLEQDALSIRAPTKRAELQGDLNAKREVLEMLMDRLKDLQQMAIDDDEDDDDNSDAEDLLGDVPAITIPQENEPRSDEIITSKQTENAESRPNSSNTTSLDASATPTTISTETHPTAAPIPTQTAQTLRARTADAPSPVTPAHATARAALFSNRRKAAPPETSTATAEAILDQQRGEQDELTGSILDMAKLLKASSKKFSTTLEADKDVVGRAGEGMEKTERTMEAARGRMGALRRMTEGKGWWGRVILYAQIYALMLVVVLLVFLMPKLRF